MQVTETQNSSYNFLSPIKIQVTRVALFHETLSISGSFQPSLCHSQMWASSSWFRMVASESQPPDGGRNDEEGARAFASYIFRSFSETAK